MYSFFLDINFFLVRDVFFYIMFCLVVNNWMCFFFIKFKYFFFHINTAHSNVENASVIYFKNVFQTIYYPITKIIFFNYVYKLSFKKKTVFVSFGDHSLQFFSFSTSFQINQLKRLIHFLQIQNQIL